MSRVVVIGANGFVGIHTVKALLDQGYHVVAIDRITNKLLDRFEDDNLEVVEGDITFLNDVWNVIRTGDKVLHLAAVAQFKLCREKPSLCVRVNVSGMMNVIVACILHRAERLIFSSTGSVYSKEAQIPIREDEETSPNSLYGLTKLMGEQLLQFYGNALPYIILRYGYIYGKDKDWGAIGAFLKRIRVGMQPTVFGGKQTNDFVYIKDVVQANLLALETDRTRRIFNIGTGRGTSIQDVCEMCLDAMDSDLEMKIEPKRSFDFPVFVYDIDNARTLLGYNPKWSLMAGIRDMVKEIESGQP